MHEELQERALAEDSPYGAEEVREGGGASGAQALVRSTTTREARAARQRPGASEPGMRVAADSAIDGAVFDQVVDELNRLHACAGLDLALRMGKIIVDRFYDGDLSSWRKHRKREVSFRKLVARTRSDLRVGATLLYRSVALYELACRVGLDRVCGLTKTHLRVVLGLPEDRQLSLLDAAARECWPSKRLEHETARERRAVAVRRGRPPEPPLIKAVRALSLSSRQIKMTLDDDESLDLSPGELRSLYSAINELEEKLRRLSHRLENPRPAPPAVAPPGSKPSGSTPESGPGDPTADLGPLLREPHTVTRQ